MKDLEEVILMGNRSSLFDVLSSEHLIAELRHRNFKVYKARGMEMLYDWDLDAKSRNNGETFPFVIITVKR